ASAPRSRRRFSMPASSPRAWARASCAPKRRGWRRSPRSARCGETSREQICELRVAVVACDVDGVAPAPRVRAEVDAAAGDEELDRELVVALHGIEELPFVVVVQAHRRKVLARLQTAIDRHPVRYR